MEWINYPIFKADETFEPNREGCIGVMGFKVTNASWTCREMVSRWVLEQPLVVFDKEGMINGLFVIQGIFRNDNKKENPITDCEDGDKFVLILEQL